MRHLLALLSLVSTVAAQAPAPPLRVELTVTFTTSLGIVGPVSVPVPTIPVASPHGRAAKAPDAAAALDRAAAAVAEAKKAIDHERALRAIRDAQRALLEARQALFELRKREGLGPRVTPPREASSLFRFW